VARSGPFANLPRFRRGSLAIFATALLLTAIIGDQPLGAQLVLTPGEVLAGHRVWAPVTTNVIFPPGGMTLLLSTLFIQWFLASPLEGFWGTRKYLLLAFGCGIAGHLVSVALAPLSPSIANTPVGGTTAIDMAAVTAFGVVFGKRKLRLFGGIEVSSRGVAIFVIALSVISPVARGTPWPVVIPWLTAIAGALLVTTQPWRRLRDSGKVGGSKRKRRRSHLRVVEVESPPELLN
jgi:membrane associated rhomboid family serine protease